MPRRYRYPENLLSALHLKKVEELLKEKVVGFYEKWSEKAVTDPV